MRSFLYSLFITLVAATAFATAAKEEDATISKAHKRVINLTSSTFSTAVLEDAENPIWLLKFYAPWCGHCKKMIPILDAVAELAAGQMAIGKIDCTNEKKLCDQHGVRGYPTLKVALDGTIFDYPGGRSKDDLLAFATKMSQPPVKAVKTIEQAVEYVSASTNGVAFVTYHAAVTGATMENKLQSTLLTQVVAQVARKQIAYADFLLLQVQEDADNEETPGVQEPFFCRMEQHVEPRCYKDLKSISVDGLLAFVEAENVATVSHLGPSNFHKVGRKGRSLVIGVVDGEDKEQVSAMKQALVKYAVSGPADVRNKYYYGWFNGKLWQKFLTQFDIIPEESPQVFLLNVPKKAYWQDAKYKMNVDDFLAAVQDGTIEKKTAGKQGFDAGVERLKYAIIEYRPWSIVILVIIAITFAVGIASLVSPGMDLRPPAWKADKEKILAEAKAEAKEEAAKAKKDETKKDK